MKNIKNKIVLMLLVCFSMMLLLFPSVSSQTAPFTVLENFTLRIPNDENNPSIRGAFFLNDEYYLADDDFSRIIIYNNNLLAVRNFSVEHIAITDVFDNIASNGTHIYTFVSETGGLHIYDLNGNFITNISFANTGEGLTYNGSSFFLVDDTDTVTEILPNSSVTGFTFTATDYDTNVGAIVWNNVTDSFFVGTGNNKIIGEYSKSGTATGFNFTLPASPLNDKPFVLALATNGTHLISSATTETGKISNTSGTFITDFNVQTGHIPRDITIIDNNVYYVTDNFNENRVYELLRTGNTLSYTGFSFDTSAQDNRMRGISYNPNNNRFYLTGDNSDTMYEYSRAGIFTGNSFSLSTIHDATPSARATEFDGTHFWVSDTGLDYGMQFNESLNFTGVIINVSVEIATFGSLSFAQDLFLVSDGLAQEVLYFGKENLTFTGQIFDFSDNVEFGIGDYRASDETLYSIDTFFPQKIKIYSFAVPEKATSTITTLFLNGTQQNITLFDFETFIVTAQGINGTPNITIDGVPVANNSVQDLGGGIFEFIAFITGNASLKPSSQTFFATVIVPSAVVTGTSNILTTIGTIVIVIGVIIALIVEAMRNMKKGRKKGSMKFSIFLIMGLLLMPIAFAQSVFTNPAFDVLLITFFMVAAFIIIRNMLKDKK